MTPTTTETTDGPAIPSTTLLAISERIRTQDNRYTQDPMFCVQEKKRDVGYDSMWAANYCWHNAKTGETIFDDDEDFSEPDGDDWGKYGYVDRWETVMVAFTEGGCLGYIHENCHNHRGKLRVYAESFRRCPEMLAIRSFLLANAKGGLPPNGG